MKRKQRTRGTYAVGEKRREEILQSALLEFAEHGYRGTSLTRIAERASISEAGLRHHFANKDALLVAVLEQRDDEAEIRLESRHPLIGEADLRHHVSIVERNYATVELARLFTILTAEATNPDHPASAWTAKRYRAIRQSVKLGIQGGITSGEFRTDIDADLIARQIVAVMDGLQLQWLIDPEAVDMVADFSQYTTALLEYLRSRET